MSSKPSDPKTSVPHRPYPALRHAALAVSDLKRALQFYSEVLGFVPFHDQDRDWAMVSSAGTTLSLILAPKAKRDPNAPADSQGTYGSHPSHVGITMLSLGEVDQMQERIAASGRPTGKSVRHRDGSYGFYFQDTEGNQLECIFIPKTLPIPGDPDRAVILLSHGSRDPHWNQTFKKLLDLFRANAPGLPVELAFMEMASPRLSEVAAKLSEIKEVKRIHILPVFLASGSHLTVDIPAQVKEIQAQLPQVHFELASALGEHDWVQEAIVTVALEKLGVQNGR